MRLWMKQALIITLLAVVLAGCSFGGGSNGQAKEQQTLKVMYYDESSFYQQYGMLFSALYPNIDIQIVTTQSIRPKEGEDYQELLNKFMDEEQPDIYMLSSDQYTEMSQEGKLYELDTYLEKEKYNTETLVPGLLDYLRELGSGKLYGFATGYYSQALFYNKDLFDKYSIDYPTDRMSWSDLLLLAKRFPTDGEEKDRVYGLKMGYSDNLFQFATQLANAQNMNYINTDKMEMTFNTDGWKNVLQTSLDAVNSKALYFETYNQMNNQSYEEYLLSNPFVGGRLAMAIDGSYLMQQIKQAEDYLPDDQKAKVVANWDMVTVPVDPQNPDSSSMISVQNLFAINEKSPNKEAAWKFLEYITGDEFARVTSKTGYNGSFPVRTTYYKDDAGHNLSAFYMLKPSSFNPYKGYEKLNNFYGEFNSLAETEFQSLKDNKQSVDETLENLQNKGQEILEKTKQAADEAGEDAGTGTGASEEAGTGASAESSQTEATTTAN